MTKRSRGVLNTRCNAIVSSVTPRFGPRCPPVCERTLISSSRTSCASCGKSCSRSALMSDGEWIPSSKRFGASVISAVCRFSEEVDFVIDTFGFDRCFLGRNRFLSGLEFLYYGFASAVTGNDFNLFLGIGKTLLACFYQLHSFLVANDQIFERQLTRFHLLDNFLEPIHRALKVQLRLTRLRFTTHGETEELSTASLGKKAIWWRRRAAASGRRGAPTLPVVRNNARATLKLSECSRPNQQRCACSNFLSAAY